jgi:peptidoglycan hydrolase CwlO-like protein
LLSDLATWIEGSNVTPQAGPAELTDSSGGAVSSTLAAVTPATQATTDTTAASLTSTNNALNAIKNDIASLNAQINNVLTKLVAAGVLTSV